MVDAIFSDLVSEFILMPMGKCFPKYTDFRNAYEILKRTSKAFEDFSKASIDSILLERGLVSAPPGQKKSPSEDGLFFCW